MRCHLKINLPTQTSTQTYSNISGSGGYSISGDEITVDSQLFEYQVDGVDLQEFNEGATAKFEINTDGELIFTQNEIMVNSVLGIETTVSLVSTSVWVRK